MKLSTLGYLENIEFYKYIELVERTKTKSQKLSKTVFQISRTKFSPDASLG